MPPKTRLCPGCRQERHATQFIPDSPYCGVCREQGPEFSIEENHEFMAEARQEKQGVGKMPSDKGTSERRTCAKGCGKMVDPRGAHKHEATCAGPQGGSSPSRPAKRRYRRRKVMGRHVPERRVNRGRKSRPASETSANGCQVCGLNVAERELVAEGIRMGLGFDNAVAFVRHARVVGGREKSA